MAKPERSREPCPDRILDDDGSASALHYNSAVGARLSGASQAVRMNAPRVGGGFVVWGGLFSIFDCAFVYAHQREDPWNSIAAAPLPEGSSRCARASAPPPAPPLPAACFLL